MADSGDREVLARFDRPRPTLTLMVGPSGAGKSTWLRSDAARKLGIGPHHVLSSDDLRAELRGSRFDQTRSNDVFKVLDKRARARLAAGDDVVVDATNLKRRHRMQRVAAAPPGTRIRYVVVNRPVPEKKATDDWREKRFPGLIDIHEREFQLELKSILSGDGVEGVEVVDARTPVYDT